MAKRRKLRPFERLEIASRQHWQCNHCEIVLPAAFEIDHIKPLHEYTLYDYEEANCVDNLQALCSSCHKSKTSKENAKSRKFLKYRIHNPQTIVKNDFKPSREFNFEDFRYKKKYKISVYEKTPKNMLTK